MENDAGHVSELSHDQDKMNMRACTCMSDTDFFLKHRPYLGKRLCKCKLHLTMKINYLPGRSWNSLSRRSCLVPQQGP